MPNRILREGILTSPRIAKLGWAEEVFYRRLMSVVDDFGRYYADAGMLRAACYPRQLNKVSDSDIGKWLQVIADAALVRVYPAQDGERYLQLLDFRQQTRANKSKFPEPDSECVADAMQTHSKVEACAPVYGDVSVDVSEGEVGKESRKRSAPLQAPDDVDPQVWADWLQLRRAKKAPVTETVLTGARTEAGKARLSLEDFLRIWCRRGSQGLEASWLKEHETSQAKSFRQQDAEAARAAAATWSGGLLGGDSNTIDMEQTHGLLPHR